MKLMLNTIYTKFKEICFLCGNSYKTDTVKIDVYDDDGNNLGSMCYQCFDAKKDGVKKRMGNYALYLRKKSEWLETQAKKDFDFPSKKDYIATGLEEIDVMENEIPPVIA